MKLKRLTVVIIAAALALLSACGGARPVKKAVSYDEDTIKAAIEKYEIKVPGFDKIEHKKLEKLDPDAEPRYILYDDGVWRADEADYGSDDPDTAVIMFTGDLMCQGRQQAAAFDGETYDFRGSFSIVKDIFSGADLVVGNLETTLSESAPYMGEQKAVDGKPHCNGPSTYLDAVRFAGFDVLVNANNHDLDCGVRGIFETLQHLEDYGFAHTGVFASEEDRHYVIVEVKGMKIALMSYATYFNTKDTNFTEEGQEVLLNRYSKEKLERDIEAAREDGAEFIAAYNHWGIEHTNDENEKQRTYAQEMADAGVDYIIGSHPHALQRYDILTAADGRKVPVVYSMGNFVSHMKKVVNNDTIILRIELTRDKDGNVTISDEGYIPCLVVTEFEDKDYLIMPVAKSYSQGYSPEGGDAALTRIKAVMGEKIDCLY